MFAEVRQLSDSVSQSQLEAAVAALCADPCIDGVLVQLPLPQHIKEEAIIDSFDPQKDVDGFHPLNMGAVCSALPRTSILLQPSLTIMALVFLD